VATIDAMLGAGVDLAGVNLMTMNFGDGRDADESMFDASVRAVDASHRQLTSAYQRIGQRLSYEQVQAKIGVTPMLGQNDDADDVFTLDDAASITEYVNANALGRLGMWSLNRDNPCGPNVTTTTRPSNFCTSLDQEPLEFSETFAAVTGRPGGQAGIETVPLDGPPPIDDPATAPYPIWDGDDGFQTGDKTVWRGNVYEAKWWNEGQAPDAPVINEWETPWRLVGPVLPTDRPPEPPPTLPAGTYDEWKGTAIYEEGDRVQYDGYGYESKWWNEGQQPGKDVPNDWDTPWFLIDETGEPLD
jgi:chitinase